MSSLIACVFTGGCCKARAVARVEYDVRREDTSPKYGLGINSACPYLANSRSCDWPENHHFLLLSLAHDILDLSFLSYPVERRPYFSQLRNPSPTPLSRTTLVSTIFVSHPPTHMHVPCEYYSGTQASAAIIVHRCRGKESSDCCLLLLETMSRHCLTTNSSIQQTCVGSLGGI